MNTIIPLTAYIVGCGLGVWVLGRYPAGLRPEAGGLLLLFSAELCALAIFSRKDRQLLTAALTCCAGLAGCGISMLHHAPAGPDALPYYNRPSDVKGTPDLVVGTVAGEPTVGDRWQRIRLSTQEIQRAGKLPGTKVEGDLLALVPRYPQFQEGERLSLRGALVSPPSNDGPSYAEYLARSGVYSYMLYPQVKMLGPGAESSLGRFISDVRQAVRSSLKGAVAEPEAALAIGVVVGDRSSMPPSLVDAFRRSGTMHVLAISGENIALLIGFVWLVYARKDAQRRMPAWLTALLLVLLFAYTLFTGATPSVVRAAIMGAALLAGPLVRRRYDPVAALAASAFLMTVFDPMLAADAGFQLSFGAMLGIALIAPRIDRVLARLHLPGLLRLPLATSLGAQAVTAPLAALISGQFALVSTVATLTVDVALLPLMITGIAAGISGALPPVAAFFGLGVWLCGAWMNWWVSFWAALPGSSFAASGLDSAWLVAYYLALVLVLASLGRGATGWRALNLNAGKALLLGGAAGLAGWVFLVVAVLAH